MTAINALKPLIRTIPDYPKPGIQFRDITPLLANGDAFYQVIEHFAERYQDKGLTKIVGIEARGFIFATALAYRLKLGFVPLRKPGKLPAKTRQQSYDLEYGTDALELHDDALTATDNVLLIDDLLATGGTLIAAHKLLSDTGARIHECAFLITLNDLPGGQKLDENGIGYYTLFEF
ncbi:adenine phosphoribosyltransferase [Pseudidiomarina planktonica]|uniref:Adenine phosphoribosyltransferase n=1 Tax=Pseudidiomarina planktonica TaxID=1323738 RepID=A0A1Y6F1Y2_9GAMM|nr:adenine phosphoribosyltransferase [Pseudidiomarina planktonica]RUO64951.1 adenine phosphoribosyltransferase [Pseudidiomarina planktonica]SMQ68908.1 adenine phosphoribosyltransferase [Pseudidiomarina planktonica]